MLKVMRDPKNPMDLRVKMAGLAASIVHAKPGEKGGKKEEKEEKAKQAASGRFAPSAGPKIVPIQKINGDYTR